MNRFNGLIWFLGILLLSGAGAVAHAFDLNDHVRINGFLSQGYIDSQGNNFLSDSKDGSFKLNEFGLTFNSEISDNLRIGLQLLSRNLGEEGKDNDVFIDWGMADYRWRDWFGTRVGKVKLPMGLYNQGRDSDFLRPMAFLPQSVYDENKRNLQVAATGGSAYGHLSFGKGGGLEYQGYYGVVDFPEDSGQARGIRTLASRIAKSQKKSIIDFTSQNRHVYGGSLIYNSPIEGLRLGISYFTGKSKFDFELLGADGEIAQGTGTGNNKDFVVLSTEYAHKRWNLAAEYMEFTGDRFILGVDVPDSRSQGGYVRFSYRLLEPVAVSFLYDVFYADKDDRNGRALEARGEPAYFGWRKDLGVGVRWDVNPNWVLKAEWHDVDGAALQLPIFNPEGVERNWSYVVLKASFNF